MSANIVNKAVVSRKLGTLDVDIVDVDIPSKEDIASDVPSNPLLDDLVIIEAAAWANNPIDYKLLKFTYYNIAPPFGFGNDIAGEIVSVGKNVKDFKKGDRIVSFTSTGGHIYKEGAKNTKNLIHGGFANYPAVNPETAFKLPKDVPFETAVVIPTVFATTCEALFHIHGFPRPNIETAAEQRDSPADKRSQKKTFVVYSGGSSLGRQLIQLAAMSGYAVVTAASLKHEAELKKLGANVVVDYHGESHESVAKSIVAAVKEVGFECVGITDTYGHEDSYDINGLVARSLKSENLFNVPMITYYSMPPSEEVVNKYADIFKFVRCFAGYLRAPDGVELGHYSFRVLLQTLVDNGQYIFSPKPKIVGRGLESIIKGIEITMAGLSGEKAVTLAE